MEVHLLIIQLLYILKIGYTLVPYDTKGGHEDFGRTHRYVRDCQRKEHGNLTHEIIHPQKTHPNFLDTKYIKYRKDKHDKYKYGHRTVVGDPLNMVSVLEPFSEGSCKSNRTSSVQVTASRHNCAVAINAGFFNPEKKDVGYGKCLGNIISNGRIVQDSRGIQNACFGIRRSGAVVIGYLSEDEVLAQRDPFLQLVCGVGWVLRKGENYLEESKKAECRDTETTGPLTRFFDVVAARTLIGVDKNGHVHLVQFDGETGNSGINLYDVADYLKSIGIVNAINFDGGGSSTYVIQSTVVNYAGGHCENSKDILCPRNVSTVICIHYNKPRQQSEEHTDALTYCCNRNYLVVIGLTVIIGISLLGNVYIYGFYLSHRSRFSLFTGTAQKKEALKSLLDQNGRYSTGEDDSNDDEL